MGTYEPSMSLRDLQLDPDSLAVRFARQDVLSKSETAHLLEKVRDSSTRFVRGGLAHLAFLSL